ncbi:Protein of unknown function [Saccharopolyspora kobensis]|uniref:SMODS and SLOG-associating 2TM effector domain-containing protein n=1 Tax=Saccharopolyspora kobensis TaxID=146035 RepID=A0A1H6AKE7_9PSEU|nr:DUF4231 domain-containing protein [Saccharopolyspora kobensis]SEG48216.1 Protein of unknown function [Saccharopolyspora kobensis]SFE57493.1 Protein of unknown function [Saccharopolyspora kobensis]
MSSTDQLRTLSDADFPGLFQAADTASVRQQRSYLRGVRAQLLLTVSAAVFAAFPVVVGSFDVFAVGTALALVGVMVIEMATAGSRPDKVWYEGRALAESVKTLTWRYAVGAAPFALDSESADDDFVSRVRALQKDKPGVLLLPNTSSAITSGMRALRAAPLAERKAAYLAGRVHDQQQWYAAKAVFHQRRARIFRTIMLTMEVLGVASALAKAVGVVGFDLAGIVAAAVSAVAAWSATRQHSTTATAYVMASHELATVRDLLDRDLSEQQWSDEVVDAESAISREHTMWHANRTS